MILASKSFVAEVITLARDAASPIKTKIANIIICLMTMPNATAMRFNKLNEKKLLHKRWFFLPDFTVVLVLKSRIYDFYP